jgi:hypothetical protein
MVVFSQMRPGIESLTPEDEDRAFMETGPLFVTGLALRFTPLGKAGKLECVIACFEKDWVLMAKVRGGFLALSVDAADGPNFGDNESNRYIEMSNPKFWANLAPYNSPSYQLPAPIPEFPEGLNEVVLGGSLLATTAAMLLKKYSNRRKQNHSQVGIRLSLLGF